MTDRLPKPAVPLLDVPLAAWPLAGLMRHGLETLVNVSHLGDLVAPALEPFGAFTTLVEQPEAYGSGGTVAAVRDQVGPRLVTSNGDVLSDLDPADLLAAHSASGADATVAVIEVDNGGDFELRDGMAHSFIDRRNRPDAPGGRFLGTAVFERATLELLPDRRPVGLAEHLLQPLANSGRMAIHVHRGYYLDVGTFDGYLEASTDLLEGRGPAPPQPPPGRVVAVDGGHAYVGPGARAQASSIGPGAMVLAEARVEPGARVEHAIVWPREVVPAGTELSCCVWALGRAHSEPLGPPA